jgi:hypothetical protein
MRTLRVLKYCASVLPSALAATVEIIPGRMDSTTDKSKQDVAVQWQNAVTSGGFISK